MANRAFCLREHNNQALSSVSVALVVDIEADDRRFLLALALTSRRVSYICHGLLFFAFFLEVNVLHDHLF